MKAFPAPPLWVWAAVMAAFAAVFLLSFKAYKDFKFDDRPFMDDSLRRIESLSARVKPDKGIRAVALGSSLFRRAIFYDGRMESFARENGFTGLEFLRITRPACGLDDYAPFLDKLINARPDLLFIESDALFYIHPERSLFSEYADFLRYVLLKSMSAKELMLPKDEPFDLDRAADPALVEEAGGSRAAADFLRSRTLADKGAVEAFLQKASSAGISVVLVDMQREPAFEKMAGLKRSKTIELANGLPKEYGVALVGHPGEFGKEFFWDHAHLNEEGRVRFSLWLVEFLKGMDKRE